MIADALESSFSLLVMGERTATTLPLASGHTIVIGTDAACDVRLEGPAIAGRHAVLHIGPPQKLEVLSGTARIGELSVPAGQTALVEPGQVITLGGAMLVVQRRGRAQARRIWSHDNFEVRLEEQCIRAERFREQFVLLRLRTLSPVSALVIETVLTASLRLTDIIGQWGPNQYEVILTETTAEDSRIVFERMLTAFSAEHIEVRLGAAAFPRDGISPDALAGAAADQLRGPEEPKGPPTCITCRSSITRSSLT